MPSFADSIVLFVLALLLFGPKRLPVLARELGKWVNEFRRASNEFKMQMDDELRASEQAERQKQIAAMEAAAPLPPPLEEPEHPHLPRTAAATPSLLAPRRDDPATAAAADLAAHEASLPPATETPAAGSAATGTLAAEPEMEPRPESHSGNADGVRPIPIAVSGDLHMMPPATGLPTPRPRNINALGGLLDAIPETPAGSEPAFAETRTESPAHGD